MQRRGSPSAVEKRIGECIIDIRLRRGDQTCQHDDRNCDEALGDPASTIVTEPMQGPQKQEGHDRVEEREQPYPQREFGVEEIFGAAD